MSEQNSRSRIAHADDRLSRALSSVVREHVREQEIDADLALFNAPPECYSIAHQSDCTERRTAVRKHGFRNLRTLRAVARKRLGSDLHVHRAVEHAVARAAMRSPLLRMLCFALLLVLAACDSAVVAPPVPDTQCLCDGRRPTRAQADSLIKRTLTDVKPPHVPPAPVGNVRTLIVQH